MNIVASRGLKNLVLLNLSKLKEFKLYDNKWLEWVYIDGVNVHSIYINNVSTLFDLKVPTFFHLNWAPCKNLNLLKLCQFFIMDEWLSNLISELLFLDYILIDRCMNIRSIKISNGSLKKLFFRSCDMLNEFNLYIPSLRKFKYHGNLVSFTSNALALLETTLFFSYDNINNQQTRKLG